jgi:hypothetical protein
MSDHISWHTAMGPFGTLFWPKSQDAVELLHKEWHFHERELHRLRVKTEELKKQADMWREACKKPDLEPLAIEFNRHVS